MQKEADIQEIEDPFYLTANKIFGTIHASSAPTTKVLSALLNGGYKISRSHASPGSIKTNAPCSFMYDIVREHVKENPVRMDKIPEKSPSRYALLKPMT
jgi:tRNA (guanine26-N2/guanine27-N2)-dimethyltransferase